MIPKRIIAENGNWTALVRHPPMHRRSRPIRRLCRVEATIRLMRHQRFNVDRFISSLCAGLEISGVVAGKKDIDMVCARVYRGEKKGGVEITIVPLDRDLKIPKPPLVPHIRVRIPGFSSLGGGFSPLLCRQVAPILKRRFVNEA